MAYGLTEISHLDGLIEFETYQKLKSAMDSLEDTIRRASDLLELAEQRGMLSGVGIEALGLLRRTQDR